MDATTNEGGALSAAEFAQFMSLLRRFCSDELDQWEALKTDTPYGDVYVLISRYIPSDAAPEVFKPF
ncbi:hypothetical protein [Streptomyces sp. NPDC056463]|uniref:hypothetical protein n=1 Tax=Streptomyces sp. NPDC056463 TaxID=3345827 RepID=UPI0036944FAE